MSHGFSEGAAKVSSGHTYVPHYKTFKHYNAASKKAAKGPGLYWDTKYLGAAPVPQSPAATSPPESGDWKWEPPKPYEGISSPARPGFWYPNNYAGGATAYYNSAVYNNGQLPDPSNPFQSQRDVVRDAETMGLTDPNYVPNTQDIAKLRDYVGKVYDEIAKRNKLSNWEIINLAAMFVPIPMSWLSKVVGFAFEFATTASMVRRAKMVAQVIKSVRAAPNVVKQAVADVVAFVEKNPSLGKFAQASMELVEKEYGSLKEISGIWNPYLANRYKAIRGAKSTLFRPRRSSSFFDEEKAELSPVFNPMDEVIEYRPKPTSLSGYGVITPMPMEVQRFSRPPSISSMDRSRRSSIMSSSSAVDDQVGFFNAMYPEKMATTPYNLSPRVRTRSPSLYSDDWKTPPRTPLSGGGRISRASSVDSTALIKEIARSETPVSRVATPRSVQGGGTVSRRPSVYEEEWKTPPVSRRASVAEPSASSEELAEFLFPDDRVRAVKRKMDFKLKNKTRAYYREYPLPIQDRVPDTKRRMSNAFMPKNIIMRTNK